MAEQQQQHREQQEQQQTDATPIEGAVGASDADNGGGAGAGIPDAELVDRAGDAVTRGDVRQDREKLFPEGDQSTRPPGVQAGDEDEPRER
jgi:hypothetical protein